MSAPADWHAWFPGGLDEATAEAIAAAHWADSPHLAAALAWEAYAATLPPTPSVGQVATGAQTVSYSPPGPSGEYGAALARAAWHRSFLGNTFSVELANPDSALNFPPAVGWYLNWPLTHWWADA